MRIIPRSEWKARHDAGAGPAPIPADGVYLHHSAGLAPNMAAPFDDDYAVVRRLEQIGEDRFGRGISYTFVITPAGLIFEGHGVRTRGAHTKGRNTTYRAICLAGNYDTHRVTAEQVTAVQWLLATGKAKGWWSTAKLAGGHRQAPGASTACPGRYGMAAIALMNRPYTAHATEEDPSMASWDEPIGGKGAAGAMTRDQLLASTYSAATMIKGISDRVGTLGRNVEALTAAQQETNRLLGEISTKLDNTGGT